MEQVPFRVEHELEGWSLYWADLELLPGGADALGRLRLAVASEASSEGRRETLSTEPTVAALRRLYRAAGTDPTRYRPSSEALLRRLLKGNELPSIHPLVDINNCLSARLAVPCCVMAAGTFAPPLRFRAGRPGESYESLRGPFKLEGRPLLVDAEGPVDTPITGSQRVKVTADTRRAWLVAYLPIETVSAEVAHEALCDLLAAAPVARIVGAGASG